MERISKLTSDAPQSSHHLAEPELRWSGGVPHSIRVMFQHLNRLNFRATRSSNDLIQPNRSVTLNAVQLAVNILLGLWIYSEYLNNRFMRQYLDSFWASNGLVVSAGLAGVAIVGGTFLFFSRRSGFGFLVSPAASASGPENTSRVTPLDVCPHCNVELKSVSDNRFQCRQCKRFFKK